MATSPSSSTTPPVEMKRGSRKSTYVLVGIALTVLLIGVASNGGLSWFYGDGKDSKQVVASQAAVDVAPTWTLVFFSKKDEIIHQGQVVVTIDNQSIVITYRNRQNHPGKMRGKKTGPKDYVGTGNEPEW